MSGVEVVAVLLAFCVACASAQSSVGYYGGYYGEGYGNTYYGYGSYPTEGYYSPPSPAPVYYYASPAPGGYYTSPAPVYYYSMPSPPAGYYSPPTPTYYYHASPTPVASPPSPRGLAPTDVPPAVPSPTPAPPPPEPSPSSCPVCPTCSAAPTSRRLMSAGQCYCPYDNEWKAWAVSDPNCRATLYEKCKADSRIKCDWLDAYFSADSSQRGFVRPHERDIYAYLYNDCPPAKPCSCSGLTFTSQDQPAEVYRCCSDLQIHTQVPFSGLSANSVDAYCSHNNMREAQKVKSWVQHNLWHANCPATSTPSVYTYKAAEDLEADIETENTAATSTASVKRIPADKMTSSVYEMKSELKNVDTIVAGVVGAAAGAVMAGLVMLVVMQFTRTPEQDAYSAMV